MWEMNTYPRKLAHSRHSGARGRRKEYPEGGEKCRSKRRGACPRPYLLYITGYSIVLHKVLYCTVLYITTVLIQNSLVQYTVLQINLNWKILMSIGLLQLETKGGKWDQIPSKVVGNLIK